MTAVDQLWGGWLPGSRWFQGKDRPILTCSITALPWYASRGDIWLRSELAIVDLGSRQETYHLLVGYVRPGLAPAAAVVGQIDLPELGLVDLVDAPAWPPAMRVFLRAARAGAVAGLTWHGPPPAADCVIETYTGEQSNSTVRFGDDHLMKLFRKLTPGGSLEAQVLRDLADSPVTPALLATWSSPDDSLGLVCQRIHPAQDGFNYARQACADGRAIDQPLADLGRALARLHADLARVYGTATAETAELSQSMLVRLDQACAAVPALAGRRAGLRRALALPPQTVTVQRLHGDFHLGQALVSPAGWTIIDFEGEPLKSPAERIAPDAVWRDLAGGLRSLDYARAAAATPGQAGRDWYRRARACFLAGYLGRATAPPALLTAYEVDKAIYELVYETRNRPDWAEIPRQAIEAFADRPD